MTHGALPNCGHFKMVMQFDNGEVLAAEGHLRSLEIEGSVIDIYEDPFRLITLELLTTWMQMGFPDPSFWNRPPRAEELSEAETDALPAPPKLLSE